MVIALFLVEDKERRSCVFIETFLLANINIDITLKMFFLTLNNVEIGFVGQHLNWRIYITIKILLIIRQVELIRKK